MPARWSMGCWRGAAEDVAAAEASREEALERGLAYEKAARGCNVDLGNFLVAANELAELRRRIRRVRGSVDFDTAEIRALLDEDGVPVQIVARERSCATSLIEEAMLLANECVAEWLADRDIEACYRVHEDPSPDSLHGAAVALAQLASSTIAVLPVLPWGVPMSCRLQLMLPPVRPTHRSSTRCFCAACSARCTSRATRATLRSPRRATATLRAHPSLPRSGGAPRAQTAVGL